MVLRIRIADSGALTSDLSRSHVSPDLAPSRFWFWIQGWVMLSKTASKTEHRNEIPIASRR